MTSRLQKQKHILALLNSRQDMELPPVSAPSTPSAPSPQRQLLSENRLIRQVYQFQKSIIQNINAGLLTIDLKGEITFANRSAAVLLGWEIESLLGKNLRDFFHTPGEADKFLSLCTRRGKKIDDWETRFLHKESGVIVVGINSSYLEDARNNYEGVVLLLRDLTEIHHLRNQVERMERLALLGELSAGIAHEIRNPLAGIKVATQLLAEQVEGQTLTRELMCRVIREVDKANILLKEFFKFARPTRPKPGFHSISKIIDGVYLLLASRLKNRGITYVENIEPPVPPVYLDETQLEQVLLNLFINAADAMPGGGELSVTVSTRALNVLEGAERKLAMTNRSMEYVIVQIDDTGTGIPPENLPRIFNPFFTTKPEGLGLGLSICSRLIEENNGKIDVISHKGRGSTFILTLPTFAHA